jgi:hypothetical protein
LSLARLLDAESKYIELTRRFNEDPGTALAQEMDALRSSLSKRFMEHDDMDAKFVAARDQFALGNLELGFSLLVEAMELLLPEQSQLHCQQILTECSLRLREFGQNRLEYPIVLVIALHTCMNE